MKRYVYLVRYKPILKVGYSEKMSIANQISRYRTYYPAFRLTAYSHNKPKQFEHYLKWKLGAFNINNELFDETCFDEAVKICERECELISDHNVVTPNNDFLL